jgi:hypothetical protein
MADQNKIAKELSAEQLTELLDKCWKTPGLTLKKIADLAAGYGVSVSLMGATSFRDSTFARHLQRIGKAAELRDQLRDATKAGNSTADAAALIISDEVLDKLVNRDPDEELDLDVLSKIVKRLRDSEARKMATDVLVKEYERKEAERAEKKKEITEKIATAKSKGGLTPETIKEIEEKLLGL